MALTDFILHFLQLQRYTINARIYKFYSRRVLADATFITPKERNQARNLLWNLYGVGWCEECTCGGVSVHFETIFKQMCYFLYFLWLFFVHYRIKFRKFAACIFGCRGFLLK